MTNVLSDNNDNIIVNNTNTSILLLNDKLNNSNKTKSLRDEANIHIESMKIGENFKKIINEKGRTVEQLIALSPDESYLSITYKKCCTRTDIIYLDKIASCEVGYSNNFYLKKKFENYLTIILSNNKCYEFYTQVEGSSKMWVNGINYLLQRMKKNTVNEIRLHKKEISKIWQNEIIPNWTVYRKYLHNKNKESYFTRKKIANKKKIDNKKGLEENIEILQANHEEILNLWTFGLPTWLRKNLWSIVIGNELEITENLFQGYVKAILKELINNQNLNKSTNNRLNNSDNKKDNDIKEIANDIQLIYKKNENIIKAENKPNFKEDVLLVVRSFCSFRSDVLYTKEITKLASFIYLNTENYYDAFRILCNLVIPSYLFDFIQNDVEKMKNYVDFFDILMQKYIPFLYNYFQTINFKAGVLFYKWAKNLFLRVFNYNLCLFIFDNFIIKGKIFIFQVALAILMIKQKKIINSDSAEITYNLQKTELDIDEEILFSEIEKLDIRDEYKEFFDIYALGKEKIELFQDL